jgi:hypothetical protein
MKELKDTKQELVRVPESALLSLVADKLKDRVLFAHKIEELKKHLQHATFKIA